MADETLGAPEPPAIPAQKFDSAELAEHPLLGLLGPEDRAVLCETLDRVEAPLGNSIVVQGADDQALYFVFDGEARVVRDGIDIGAIHPGDHFGELGMVLQRRRAASVQALTQLQLARLDRSKYLHLIADHPQTAVRLLETVVGGVAARLEEMTDNVSTLLRDRSLARRTEVRIRIGTQWQTLRTGTPVGAVLPRLVGDAPVVAALVDHRIVSLSWPLTSQCSVAALTTADAEGQEVVRNSAALLLLEAAYKLDPSLQLEMGYSIGVGRRIVLREPLTGTSATLAHELEQGIHALIHGGGRPREEWWTVEEARDHFVDRGWESAATLLRTWHHPTVSLCSYGEVYALSFSALVEDLQLLHGTRVVSDHSGLYLHYPSVAIAHNGSAHTALVDVGMVSQQTSAMTNPQEKWLQALGVRSVGNFNDACIRGDVAQMIRVAEGFQEKRIIEIADRIREHHNVIRIVSIAGPSSSGKTTFIKRLKVQLQVDGLQPVGLSLDDYYIDREQTPRDEKGDYDFEAFEALRFQLLQEHLQQLLAGQEVATARYDFQTGHSHPAGGPLLHLRDNEILLLEGIHGLNPALLAGIDMKHVFSIFVCPLAQLPFDRLTRINASDVRLLRRIVRDRHTRNHDAAQTIARWPSVRMGERKHIFPYQGQASAVFDSSLIYEVSVLKVFAQRYLLEVPSTHPSYATAARLLSLLDRFVTIYPDHVPPTSILREFIGSSGFEY